MRGTAVENRAAGETTGRHVLDPAPDYRTADNSARKYVLRPAVEYGEADISSGKDVLNSAVLEYGAVGEAGDVEYTATIDRCFSSRPAEEDDFSATV